MPSRRAQWRPPRLVALLVVAAAVLVGACSGDGDDGAAGDTSGTGGSGATATLAVSDFTSVVVAGSMDVEVTVGPAVSAEVRGDAAQVPEVSAEASGDTLFLRTPEGFSPVGNLVVVLTTPSLAQASIAGTANLQVSGVQADRFVAEIAGSGNLNASGTATDLTAVLGGRGSLGLEDLVADTVDVQLIGQGNVGVHATETLKVNIIGNGNVVYRGDPTVDQVVNGNGTVQKAG